MERKNGEEVPPTRTPGHEIIKWYFPVIHPNFNSLLMAFKI